MARETGSGRPYKFWWVLAFTLGTAGGALASQLLHAQNTVWIILFLGAVTGAVAIFEQFGDSRGRESRAPINPARWGGRSLPVIRYYRVRRPMVNFKRAGLGSTRSWQEKRRTAFVRHIVKPANEGSCC
jgi:hypothetical protein